MVQHLDDGVFSLEPLTTQFLHCPHFDVEHITFTKPLNTVINLGKKILIFNFGGKRPRPIEKAPLGSAFKNRGNNNKPQLDNLVDKRIFRPNWNKTTCIVGIGFSDNLIVVKHFHLHRSFAQRFAPKFLSSVSGLRVHNNVNFLNVEILNHTGIVLNQTSFVAFVFQ